MGLTKRIYLDSCIIIYSHESTQEIQENIFNLLFSGKDAEITQTSDLARFECLIKPIREKDDMLISQYKKFFQLPEVELVQLTREVFDIAANLRAKQNLKTPDAIHLAAAIHAGCDEFWTNDRRLEKAANGKIILKMLP